MFNNLSDRFEGALRKLSGRGKISESNVREAMEDVRTALLEADVHYEVVEEFVEAVLEQAVGEEVLSSLKPAQQMIKIVNDELVRVLGGEEDLEGQTHRSFRGHRGRKFRRSCTSTPGRPSS